MNKVIEDLNWRYATKDFDSQKKLSGEQMETVLESLRLSASSFGLQPWKFVVVKNQELREKLVTASWNQRQVADAAELIVMCAPNRFGEDDVDRFLESTVSVRGVTSESLKGYGDMMKGFLSRMDDAAKKVWMKDQVYIALGHLLSTCAAMRIDSCQWKASWPLATLRFLALINLSLSLSYCVQLVIVKMATSMLRWQKFVIVKKKLSLPYSN